METNNRQLYNYIVLRDKCINQIVYAHDQKPRTTTEHYEICKSIWADVDWPMVNDAVRILMQEGFFD